MQMKLFPKWRDAENYYLSSVVEKPRRWMLKNGAFTCHIVSKDLGGVLKEGALPNSISAYAKNVTVMLQVVHNYQ